MRQVVTFYSIVVWEHDSLCRLCSHRVRPAVGVVLIRYSLSKLVSDEVSTPRAEGNTLLPLYT